MDHRDHLTLEQAAQLEGLPYKTLQKRYHRKRIVWMNDPIHTQRKLYPITVLSPEAREKWLREQSAAGPQDSRFRIQDSDSRLRGNDLLSAVPHLGQSTVDSRQSTVNCTSPEHAELSANSAPKAPAQSAPPPDFSHHSAALQKLQPSLPFLPPSSSQVARDAVVAAIPKAQQIYVDRWLGIIADNVNGTWKRYLGTIYGDVMVENRDDFMRGQAHLYDVSKSSIYSKLKTAKAILGDAGVPKQRKWMRIAESQVPRLRPGRSGHTFFADPENAWMWPELRRIYLNQARHSMRAARDILIEIIKKKQEAWGIGHLYQIPSAGQVRTALMGISKVELVLAREGEEAYRNKCAPYIKRRPPENSGDFSVTDDKVFDILCHDPGWRLGRLWMVNFLDVGSWRRLGTAYGPAVSGDMVMEAAARMLSGACVPGHVHMDLGKEFIGARFNGGMFRISGERLFAETMGLWRRLGVEPVKAIGGNPQTKIIERWHACIRGFEQSFSTYTGRNPQERPERLALLEKQAKEFKEGKAPPPPIPSVDQVITAFEWWCEEKWNAEHRSRGRYLQGMTPNEAWNVRRPAAGFRTLTDSELDYYTADRRFLKIARGGQVNLSIYGQTLEYTAPELFHHQDKEAEVLVSRLGLDQVTVIYPVVGGTQSCLARLKDELPWGSESRAEVKVRLRCINSLKRLVKRSVHAITAGEDVLAEAPFLPTRALLDTMAAQQVINPRQFFGTSAAAPGPNGKNEICSTEYMAEKLGLEKPKAQNRRAPRTSTSGETARRMLDLGDST